MYVFFVQGKKDAGLESCPGLIDATTVIARQKRAAEHQPTAVGALQAFALSFQKAPLYLPFLEDYDTQPPELSNQEKTLHSKSLLKWCAQYGFTCSNIIILLKFIQIAHTHTESNGSLGCLVSLIGILHISAELGKRVRNVHRFT